MKRILLLLFFVISTIFSMGQSLSVASFNELSNDLDARANYTKTDPQTGKKYAILKVVTTQTGFNFDIGSLALGGTEYHPEQSAIWVYIPEGTKKIMISHPQLGQLKTTTNDGYYWFNSPIKTATCYRLELVSGTVTTTVEAPQQQMGWLILKSNPSEADVYLTTNGVESLVGTTPFQQKLAYGSYRFRLSKPLYHDEVGMAQINQSKVEYAPNLAPAHGRIHITSTPSGAKVSIDGFAETYTTPCTTAVLASGEYKIRVSKEKYSAAQQSVTINDGKTEEVQINLSSNFARVTINSLQGAEIFLNGTKVGTSNYSDELTPGVYEMEARLANHKTARQQIEVEANKPQTLTLNPTPIYGSLDVMTTPMEATVKINGKNYGETPTTVENLLIGTYTVELSKTGYATETAMVTIEDGKTAILSRTLSNGREIAFTSMPTGASLYVDGKLIGSTPQTLQLTYGNHTVKLSHTDGEVTDNINLSATSQNSYRYELYSDLTFTVKGVKFKMVKVEGGTFTMGATAEQGGDADGDEIPTHQVTLNTYYIGQTEVTQALWQSVMGKSVTELAKKYKGYIKGIGVGPNYPMYYISWDDCQEFIKKLNQLTGKTFRLPTEAEWEYAARGGKKSKGYKYAGCNDIEAVAWYINSSTHPVASKAANELGLYDMSGNVWEWCQDWYGGYSSSSQTNLQGPSSGSTRVSRGGSWVNIPRLCRVSYRGSDFPASRDGLHGLRLVLLP